MTSVSETQDQLNSASPTEAAADVVLTFAAAMLRAGNPASRTRSWTEVVACKLGFDAVSVSLSLDDVIMSFHRGGDRITAIREIRSPGINAARIAALEQLARTVEPGAAPGGVAVKLAQIESATLLYSPMQTTAAVGVASGAFAFLNGAAPPEMIATAIGGAIGQYLRSWLSRRHFNHHGVAGLSALVASTAYVLAATLMPYAGLGFAHYSVGLIASVLFLVPGFPLIAGLFDLLQYQTVAAVSRLAYGVMMLLAVALGLSIVIGIAGIDVSREPPLELAYPLKLLLRAAASFVAASAFAMLFNGSHRMVSAAGLLAVVANDLRLGLVDLGMMPAPAAFLAALTIGLVALLMGERFGIPRMAMTVAPIVIMVPGISAFEMIVLFNRGHILGALQATATFGFVIGALAVGLATALFFNPRQRA
jgi:uncharacterized membrane protein YjjP (DUF1212 family)